MSHAASLGIRLSAKSERFNFRFCPVGNDDRGDFAATEFAHCLPYSVAVDDDAFVVDDDRNHLSEMPNKLLELLDLTLVVTLAFARRRV